ncbi:MAG: ATP-dependent Clp protease ATP-binding subunit [Clostridiales bacterium]|nr:ATP-dependent Clp protease ATP-binding subunit [Clostridiales bacterium]
MASRFTEKAEGAINRALAYASDMGHNYIGSEHILLGLMSEENSAGEKLLSARGAELNSILGVVEQMSGTGDKSILSANDMTPRTKKIIQNSALTAANCGHGYIGTEHLLYALLIESSCVALRVLESTGVSVDALRGDVESFLSGSGASGGEFAEAGAGVSGINRQGSTSIKNAPTLSSYGRDLCAMARDGKLDPIIGRRSETERVIQILSRRTKNNPCLIGEPGVGKTAVVEGLAQKIVDGEVPENLRGKTIVTLDVSGMVAGAKYRGEFEERIKNVMSEVKKNPDIILFIDEIHTIIGAGAAEGAIDAANILKPALARGELQVIGATTIEEYRRHIEHDAALERRFQSVLVGEPTEEEAIQILFGLRDKYEAHHKLKISDEAITAAVKLSSRYINDRYLPDKAIDLVDEAASRLRIMNATPTAEISKLEDELKAASKEKEEAVRAQDFEGAAKCRDREHEIKEKYDAEVAKWKNENDGHSLVVGEDEIANIVTQWTGIPVSRLAEEENERLLHLEELLHERVIGQDAAVSAVARAIRRGRMGLKDPTRPVGSFIFLGPTGVGKTELSKALADVMFGSENSMIRIDMSEYMESHSTSKLIGSPPGYVGYDEGGQLTEKIRRHPYSVVLFDEIEKAHPDVFNILLQILDDGILTDAQGRRVDFKNAIIIMTSNVGAEGITSPAKHLGFTAATDPAADYDSMRAYVTDSLKHTFKPEFLNRVDEIIVFDKLGEDSVRRIADMMLSRVKKRIEEQGISVDFGDDVSSLVVKEGFDEAYGARPIHRAVVRLVEDTFSEAMLEGGFKSGDRISAHVENGKTVYEKL